MRKEFVIAVGASLAAVLIAAYCLARVGLLGADLGGQYAAVTVPFEKVADGTHSGVATRVNYLIVSAEEMRLLWKMINATGTPPDIDFSTQSVAAVFAGERPNTGYAIQVSKVWDATKRIFSITIKRPGDNCMTGQALTTPYEIVAVPATTLPLTHEDTEALVACE